MRMYLVLAIIGVVAILWIFVVAARMGTPSDINEEAAAEAASESPEELVRGTYHEPPTLAEIERENAEEAHGQQ